MIFYNKIKRQDEIVSELTRTLKLNIEQKFKLDKELNNYMFYERNRKAGTLLGRLTSPILLIVIILLLFVVMPIKFLLTGKYKYDVDESKMSLFIRVWSEKTGMDIM
jgi:hypothetical protein